MALLNHCDNCGKVPKKIFHKITELIGNGVYMFCSKECKEEYIHANELEKKYGIKRQAS